MRETSEIGLWRPSSVVLCKNNSNDYPRTNCHPKPQNLTFFSDI
ncbi:hypothetical protein ACWIUD_09580 [Helicobacter sp. 23-1044]